MSWDAGDSDDGELAPAPEAVRHDYRGRCWWCGAVADSREHRYKRSDLVQEFGDGNWAASGGVVRVPHGAPMQSVQGPGSKKFTFEKVLCTACNNARSQPFDMAYSVFSDYFRQNESRLLKNPTVDFGAVYGATQKDSVDALIRYWVKHVCCRLAEGGVDIPSALIAFMDGPGIIAPHLTLEVGFRADLPMLGKMVNMDIGGFWLGELEGSYSKSSQCIIAARSHLGYRSLLLRYDYSLMRLRLGPPRWWSGWQVTSRSGGARLAG